MGRSFRVDSDRTQNHGTIRLILLIILTLIPILGPILSIFLVMGLSASRVWLLAAFIVCVTHHRPRGAIAEADDPPDNSDVLLIIATFGLSGIWRGIVDFSWSWSSFASYGVTYLLAWICKFGFGGQRPSRGS